MRIPLSAPDISEADIAAVVKVLRGNQLSLGPRLERFEADLAGYTGAVRSVAVSSGTAGLHLCLRALDIGPGDEVVTTPFSFIASANAILYVGARPVFVDIDPDSLNIDPERLEAAITPRTRAILVVHAFGRPAAMGAIQNIAERHGLAVIEDACEAIGGTIDGRQLGTLGTVGVFAFYPNKQMTTGEGGAVVTDDVDLAERIHALRNHGRPRGKPETYAELGYNYRLSEMQCALGIEQLKRLDSFLELRTQVAEMYRQRLGQTPQVRLPEASTEGKPSWFVYVVRLEAEGASGREHRDAVLDQLRRDGIGCARYFAPIHLQDHYTETFGFRRGDFPITEAASDTALALPFFNRLKEAQVDEVCRRLRDLIG
jgi:perosamine synthetase